MINEIKDHVVTQYYCAYNDDLRVIHIGITEVGSNTITGQPHLEVFEIEAELESRVDELMGAGYYQQQNIEE